MRSYEVPHKMFWLVGPNHGRANHDTNLCGSSTFKTISGALKMRQPSRKPKCLEAKMPGKVQHMQWKSGRIADCIEVCPKALVVKRSKNFTRSTRYGWKFCQIGKMFKPIKKKWINFKLLIPYINPIYRYRMITYTIEQGYGWFNQKKANHQCFIWCSGCLMILACTSPSALQAPQL